MKKGLIFVALAFTAAIAGSPGQDPLEAGKGMYKLKFENEKVRVMEVTFKPGQRIGWHTHPDHLGYAITAGTLIIYRPDGSSQTAKLKKGDVLFIPAEKHKGRNVGKTTVKVLVVELKPAAAASG